MNLAYKNNKLQKSLTDAREIQKSYGTMARKVAQRMEQFLAAPNLAILMALQGANCHPLKGDRNGEWVVNISGNYRLIFEINQNPIPANEDGSINTNLVTDIRIMGKDDYHKK